MLADIFFLASLTPYLGSFGNEKYDFSMLQNFELLDILSKKNVDFLYN